MRGVTVYEEGALPAGPGHGRYLPRPGSRAGRAQERPDAAGP